MHSKKVAVIAAGSWGTALAKVLAENEHEVWLWARNEDQVNHMNLHRENRYLPGVALPSNIQATTSLQEAVDQAHVVLFAAPSSAMREMAAQVHPFVNEDALIIHATKGFEPRSLKRMSEVIAEEMPRINANDIVVLSGPSHAEEVAVQCPTTVVVAAASLPAAEKAQLLLMNRYFRVYTHTDVIGVETGGALKNIIAIGAGISDGLGFGDNAKAALITRGLAEISRLGVAMGAEYATFSGLAGMGDLIVTCTSRHSRNWRVGYAVGQGKRLEQAMAELGMAVEGVQTANSAYELSEKHGVSMPITAELNRILFHHKDPRQAVLDLMERERTQEI